MIVIKKELLSPAGNMECLKAAIHNGADAIYLAGKNYGARKFANNFSKEELKEATSYAHLYGVKIYVTVNTIIYEDEMEDALKYVEFLYNIGVDAIIVQDIGLIKLVREYIPDMEIHASTQAHTHNIEQIKFLEALGVKRVVLAREMSIDEINKLDTNMELEVFIHGALCICYSGQCLFSSCVLNRSGNRGECAGLCRISYNLIKEDEKVLSNKYLLSPKEFNTTGYIDDLRKSKVYSLKIEGRMKSPEYVGYVTRMYRKILDNPGYKLSQEEIFNLKSLYNRGFTKGYLFGASDSDFINTLSSNHLGVLIGEVIEIKDKIKIRLSHELNQGDAIRLPDNSGMFVNFLYNDKMMLINQGKAQDIIYIDNKNDLKVKGKVSLTVNKKLMHEFEQVNLKKINIDAYFYAHVGEKLVFKYTDGVNEVEYAQDMVSEARSMAISYSRVKEILSKLGNTPFQIHDLDIDMGDNVFIAVGVINEIRRKLVQELILKRTSVNRCVNTKMLKSVNSERRVIKFTISALARNEEQLKALIKNKVDYIYVTDEGLYQKYKNDNVYLRVNRVISNHDSYNGENLLIGETGSLIYTKSNFVVSDYYLNVVNSYYANYLGDLGVKRITISPEVSLERLELITKNLNSKVELEYIIYGSLEYMIMKYNMKKTMMLDDAKYYLEDKAKRRYPIVSDQFTHIISDKKLNYINEINYLKKIGINTFRLELFRESEKEIDEILKEIRA